MELHSGVASQVQGESSFTHGWTGRKNYEVRLLPTLGDAVQSCVARRHSAKGGTCVLGLFNIINGEFNQIRHLVVVAAQIVFAYLKQLVFGTVEQVENIGGVFVGVFYGFRRNLYESALYVFLQYDARVVLNIG